jgi:carbon-monoxide dehydrogenase medium subunit
LKPPPFDYYAPSSISEAVTLLAQVDDARVLAGGQSLMAMLNMRLLSPERLIDLNTVAGLDGIVVDGDEIVIGAMVRQRRLQSDPTVARLPLFAKALRHVGHLQTRNRGTIGGSLCHLDPSAELPAIAMAYDSVVETASPSGARRIAFADFPVSYLTSALRPDEIMTAVRVRPWIGRTGCGFEEFSRRHGDFAIAGAVALLSLADDGAIARVSLTIFGASEAPIRVAAAERMLVGRKPDRATFEEAARCCVGLATIEDPFGSASYRGHVAAAMAERALAEAASEASA